MIELELTPAAVPPVSPLRQRLESQLDEKTRALIHSRRFGKTHRRGWLVRRSLALADVVGLVLAFALAELLLGQDEGAIDKVDARVEVALFLLTLPAWIVLARLFGLYTRDEEHADHTTVDDASGVFVMVTVGAFLLIAGSWATGSADPYMPKLVLFWAAAIVLVSFSRAGARAYVRRSSSYLQNTVIVGAGDIAQLIASKILRHREYGINLLGFVDKQPRSRRDDIGELTILGDIAELPEIVDELDVERVIVAFSGQDQGRLLDDLRPLRTRDVQVDVVPRFFDLVGPGAEFHAIEGMPIIGLAPARLPLSSLVLKRSLDIVVSAILLVLLVPLMLYIIVRIKLDSPGPALFRQERPGRGGKRIKVLKFRTMLDPGSTSGDATLNELDAAEFATSFKLRDDPRITRYGRSLRRRSLDELPQLVNVLAGSMSLVGPRPMLLEELAERADGAGLLTVKPGITGYWQINGRSDLDYADRVRLESAYIGDWSLTLDLAILGKTVRSVVTGQGAR